MVKVLIYSSKEIYKNSSYEGRAESSVIAYAINNLEYQVVKNTTGTVYFPWDSYELLKSFGTTSKYALKRHIEELEYKEYKKRNDGDKTSEC